MTLIIAAQTSDGKIIVAADGLRVSYDSNADANLAASVNKLFQVKQTDWVLTYAGDTAMDVFCKRIDAEVELGQRPRFDRHIEIGGPAYLNAIQSLAIEAQNAAPGKTMNETTAILAGFSIDKTPFLLQSTVPRGGFFCPGPLAIAAATGPATVAVWLLNSMYRSCNDLDSLKRLLYFSIWEVSRFDYRIGRLESGFPITLCLMEHGKPPQYESATFETVNSYLARWEDSLQSCLIKSLAEIPLPVSSETTPSESTT